MVTVLTTRRRLVQAFACLGTATQNNAEPVVDRYSFWVFGLLNPSRLEISGVGSSRLHLDWLSAAWILEPGRMQAIDTRTAPLRVTGPDGRPVSFVLEMPGVLRRSFHGTLKISADGNCLIPVVTMQREIAVSSVVGAELPLARTGDQALMAQAVITRSFLAGIGSPRHRNAFFCDTTHCQFLRCPAPLTSRPARAVAETSGVVIGPKDSIIPVSYSAACGGFTNGGERDGFCYRSVSCRICRELGFARRGHGWGLCQEGAIGLAQRGCKWRGIIDEYFPNAGLRQL